MGFKIHGINDLIKNLINAFIYSLLVPPNELDIFSALKMLIFWGIYFKLVTFTCLHNIKISKKVINVQTPYGTK